MTNLSTKDDLSSHFGVGIADPPSDPTNNPKSFSKLILKTVALTYFVGLGLGIILIIYLLILRQSSLAVDCFNFIMTVTGSTAVIAIGFYEWKSKHENVLKIAQALNKVDHDSADNYLRNNDPVMTDLLSSSSDELVNQILNERSIAKGDE